MARPPGRPRGSGRKSPLFNKPDKYYGPDPIEPSEPAPNFDLLDEATKELLRQKAEVKVEAAERERAENAWFKAEMARIEKELHPEAFEEQKEILIDLALYADRIMINGVSYMHGRTYTVGKSLYDAMRDIMARTHKHYADTHRDPMRAMQEAAQAIAKGGAPGFAQINASSGQQVRF